MGLSFSEFQYSVRSFLASSRDASKFEVLCISVVFLSLPLFEALKNTFSILFLLAWVVQAARLKAFGGKSQFNLLIFGLMLILWISPLFSAYSETITPLNSAPRWSLLAFFVICAAKLDYSAGQLKFLWGVLLIGGVLSVGESFWAWSLNDHLYPELRSVGAVNHSGMFTLVVLAVAIGAIFSRSRPLIVLGVLGILATFTFLIPSRSLISGLATACIIAVSIIIATKQNHSWRIFIISTLGVTAGIVCLFSLPVSEGFRLELIDRISGDDIFSGRDRLINSALAVWDQHPIIGTGWFSFLTATSEEAVRSALEADGKNYNASDYLHHPHGHNLWVTMQIERGLLGVVLVTALVWSYGKFFAHIAWGNFDDRQLDRAVALACLLIVVGFVVAGLGNTTMMNEHGHAGMAFIAVACGYFRRFGYAT